MSEREPLSVTVITLNEERNLGRCLASVSWADELIVLDSGSTDGTVEIAERHGARVFTEEWQGFVTTKNSAVAKASHGWVLSLDADEWLTDEGADEIRSVLRSPDADAYAINRRSVFCGAFLEALWNPDWVVRLFRKDRAVFSGGHVHESIRMHRGSRVRKLREPLAHIPYRTIEDYVARMNRYTGLAADTLHEKGKSASITRMLFSPPLTFMKYYILKMGFRDGVRGLVVSAGSGFYVLLKYAKLWEKSRPTDPALEDPDHSE